MWKFKDNMKIFYGIVFLVIFFTFSLSGNVYALSRYSDPKAHLGTICIECHQRYSAAIKNPKVSSFTPCYDRDCHKLADRWGGKKKRERTHLLKKVCENCHREIHTTHRDKVNCRICHMSPRGWNSSKVRIPIPKEQIVFEGITISVPERADCEYCHFNIPKATNIHEIHAPGLKNNQTCVKCHGKVIEKRPDLIARVRGVPLVGFKKKLEPLPIREFLRLFDEIAKEMMEVIVRVR
jgi:hypothetical protein